MKPACPAQPVASYLKQLQLPLHASSRHLAPGRAFSASRPCQGKGWQRVAMQGGIGLLWDASMHVLAGPPGSGHGGWCRLWFPACRRVDRPQEPKGQCRRSRVFAMLPWREAQRDVSGGSWLRHQEGETETAPVVSQTRHAGLWQCCHLTADVRQQESLCK